LYRPPRKIKLKPKNSNIAFTKKIQITRDCKQKLSTKTTTSSKPDRKIQKEMKSTYFPKGSNYYDLLLLLMHKLLQDYITATDAQFSSCIATNASAKQRNSETENDPEAPRLNAKKRSANCPPVRSLARSLVLQRKSKSHRFL
jgi:hypothetical protein